MLKFINEDVAAKYTSSFKGDPVIHYPGGVNKNGFKKKLSTITLAEADRIFEQKNQNTLQLNDSFQEADNQKTIDYSSWSVKKLKEELTKRTIEFSSDANKETLIALLTANDQT